MSVSFLPPSQVTGQLCQLRCAQRPPSSAPLSYAAPRAAVVALAPCDREADHTDGMQRIGSYIQHNLPDPEVETYKCVGLPSYRQQHRSAAELWLASMAKVLNVR